MNDEVIERGFTVDVNPKDHAKRTFPSEGDRDGALFEGILGEFEELGMMEGAVLTVRVV